MYFVSLSILLEMVNKDEYIVIRIQIVAISITCWSSNTLKIGWKTFITYIYV